MRRITDQLVIGDEGDAMHLEEDHEFDRVISVGYWKHKSDSPPSSSDHDLYFDDGPHDYEDFAEAADCLRSALEDGETVFIHCQMGVSRSTGVATAVLAVLNGTSWSEELYKTRAGYAPVGQEIIQSAKRYIREQTGDNEDWVPFSE